MIRPGPPRTSHSRSALRGIAAALGVAGRFAFATGGYVGGVFELSLDGTPLEDGSLLRRLTQPRNYAYQPEWSPDGRRIVFTRRAEWETVQLFLVKVGNGEVRTLTKASAPPASDAEWSADGRKVVFVRGDVQAVDAARQRSEGEIYVINADGTGLTRLTHNHLTEGSPAWQPVGPPLRGSGGITRGSQRRPCLQLLMLADPVGRRRRVVGRLDPGRGSLSDQRPWDAWRRLPSTNAARSSAGAVATPSSGR